jgi:Domain of unknown function (DUF6458)
VSFVTGVEVLPSPAQGKTTVEARFAPTTGGHLVRIGLSLVLLAAGAILTWAVSATVSGVNIHVVGVILMVVGALGIVLSLIATSTVGGGPGSVRRRDVVTTPSGDQTVRDSTTTQV